MVFFETEGVASAMLTHIIVALKSKLFANPTLIIQIFSFKSFASVFHNYHTLRPLFVFSHFFP